MGWSFYPECKSVKALCSKHIIPPVLSMEAQLRLDATIHRNNHEQVKKSSSEYTWRCDLGPTSKSMIFPFTDYLACSLASSCSVSNQLRYSFGILFHVIDRFPLISCQTYFLWLSKERFILQWVNVLNSIMLLLLLSREDPLRTKFFILPPTGSSFCSSCNLLNVPQIHSAVDWNYISHNDSCSSKTTSRASCSSLACMFEARWLFICHYKVPINVLFCMTTGCKLRFICFCSVTSWVLFLDEWRCSCTWVQEPRCQDKMLSANASCKPKRQSHLYVS